MNELKDLLNELRSELKTSVFLSVELFYRESVNPWDGYIISVKKPIGLEFDVYEYDSLAKAIEGVKNLLEINKILQK